MKATYHNYGARLDTRPSHRSSARHVRKIAHVTASTCEPQLTLYEMQNPFKELLHCTLLCFLSEAESSVNFFGQGLLNVDQLDRIHWIRVILDIIIINALVTAILPSALPLPS